MQSTKVDVNVNADCDADAVADSSSTDNGRQRVVRCWWHLRAPLLLYLPLPLPPALSLSLTVCLLLFGPPLLIYASRRQAKQQIEFRLANK